LKAVSAEVSSPDPAEAPAAEASRVTGLLSYAILLGGLTTIVLSLYVVVTSYSSLPYWDGWRQIEVAAHGFNPVNPDWLWAQHNEHRLVLPKIFLAIDLRFFQARQVFLLAGIFVIQLLHLALLSWSMRALGGWKGDLWRTGTGVAAFCLFCPTQSENFTWGFQVCFVLPPFFATLSFVALLLYCTEAQHPRKQASPRFLVVSILAAAGAAYSLASGNLLWPLLVVAAIYLRLRARIILGIAATGAVSLAFYLYHYTRPVGHASPVASLAAPLKMVKYCAAYFLSAWPYYDVPGYWLVRLAVLILLLVLLAAALLQIAKLRAFAMQLVFIMLYCLATGFLTAAGRLNFGISQATVSRYQTVALLFWCCLGLLWLGGSFLSRARMSHLFLVAQLCLLAIFVVAATRAKYQILLTRGHAFTQKAAGAALLSGMADSVTLAEVYPEKEMFTETLPYMRANHLSVFSDRLASTLGQPLSSAFPMADSKGCSGSLEAVFPLSDSPSTSSFGGGLGSGLRVSGWAWDNQRQKLPSAIVAAIDDKVVGFGATGRWRQPRSDGFVAFSPEFDPQSAATFYAILNTSPPSACYIATLHSK